MRQIDSEPRRTATDWWVWFALINTALIVLIAQRYQTVWPDQTLLLPQIFQALMSVGHLGSLMVLCLFPALLCAFLKRGKFLVIPLGVVLALALNLVVLVDTYVYQLYRFHLNPSICELIFGNASREIFAFSQANFLSAGSVGALFILGECALAWILVRVCRSFRPTITGRIFIGLLCLTAICQNAMFAWADATAYIPITEQAGFLPGYFPLTARRLLGSLGVKLASSTAMPDSWKASSNLDYPKDPLKCSPPEKKKNILFLVIDSWRSDSLTSEITPNIARLRDQSVEFTNHYSGGSATRTGIFTLFYGIPGTYWHYALRQRQGPALITEAKKAGYEFSIHGSAPLTSPEFDQTAFVDVPDLRARAEGKTACDRDRDITAKFSSFLDSRNREQPFLGMVFYDAPHAFCFPPDLPRAFEPSLDEIDYLSLNSGYDPTQLLNLYRNTLHFDDSLIGEIISKLESTGELDNTILIVTGDHAQEFNDNGLNYWGHGGNFSRFQTEVPMILRWPGRPHEVRQQWSSHTDVAPTLLQELFSCSNDLSNYTVGQNLFHPSQRDFLVLANYGEYAIAEHDHLTLVHPYGRLDYVDRDLRPIENHSPNKSILSAALKQQSEFLRGDR